MKLKIQCDWCGKEFERNHNHIHEKNYCCRACLGKANAERFRLKSLRRKIIQSVTVYEDHFVIAFKSGIEMEI